MMALKNAQENLALYKKSLFRIPLVLQYNKRDLGSEGIPIMPATAMAHDLNRQLKAPAFEASALQGTGVSETLKKMTMGEFPSSSMSRF